MNKRLVAFAAGWLFAFGAIAAHADPITVVIGFGEAEDISPFSYSFIGQAGTSNSGQCPDDPSITTPCVQLGSNDSLVVSVTPPPDTFDLISFFWRYTGQQTNSFLTVSFPPDESETYQVQSGTVFQLANILAISQVTFTNTTNSIVRLDGISLTYDDGLCNGVDCEPPPCDDDCEPPPQPVPEPGTLGLLGIGLLGLSLRRRRLI